ncbi:MAG: recombination regulator RecX [Selenomonadaceae bacterium]|nr:recombination regulator RecX [Selenomonadaceae bacterium]
MREKKTALMKATDLLASQDQSTAILRRKLLMRKYSAEEVDTAIDKLKQYNYLDDEELCRRQFENFCAEEKLSMRQILMKLIQRGFDKDFVMNLLPENADEYEQNVAEKLLAKKFSAAKFDRVKAWKFLSSRGFDGEIISHAVENFDTDTE